MHLEGEGWYLNLLDGMMLIEKASLFKECKQKMEAQ
jgi:hypothetical protein